MKINKLSGTLRGNYLGSTNSIPTITNFTDTNQEDSIKEKKQTTVEYMESVAEELRLNGVEKVIVNGGTINLTSLGVSMRYDYIYRPNIMADVYRCLTMLGTCIYSVHVSNKLDSINTYGGNK